VLAFLSALGALALLRMSLPRKAPAMSEGAIERDAVPPRTQTATNP